MTIHSIIAHRLVKESGEKKAESVPRHDLLPVDRTLAKFVQEVRKTYSRRSNILHGEFDQSEDEGRYSVMIDDHLDEKQDFVAFSHRAMDHLVSKIKGEIFATGGYVIFCLFEDLAFKQLLCVILNDKAGFAFDAKLNLTSSIVLQLDKLQMAGQVNITNWKKDLDRYVEFAGGSKAIPDYFRNFMGSTGSGNRKQVNRNFVAALDTYLKATYEDDEARQDMRSRVFEYADTCRKQQKPIVLKTISGMVTPADQNEEEQTFFEIATVSHNVDSMFMGHKDVIRQLRYYRFTSPQLTISLDRDLFASSVRYDRQSNTLTIENVPERVAKQLLDEQS